MHPCPCCGYRTLPSRGDYELCPVCWWEDEGTEPWEISGPNGQSLVEAQHAFLTDDRPYRQREGTVRAPRKKKARDPAWRPLERTPELMARADQAGADYMRSFDEDRRRHAKETAADPEGPMEGYNSDVETLRAEAPDLSYREVRDRLRQITSEHGVPMSSTHIRFASRLMTDEGYYRGHPLRTAAWMVRHARPRTYRQRWEEVRTGTIRFSFAR
ncbi:CPCC family cysteine-rich protein [Aeromicrobium sp. Root472D3]|uniref:CPCC family cysteine-rich protein n=1 Tax=Aeromicrobium sp. Root472D3 TaxID=1736540 RepID=UPI0006FDFCF9|nr:CPCC family cysteine-rich protein [Aeromicrobium sp. Root472D3]KQX74439.1 hypothetical protein ASD10_04155 [Aeromicrobium sp. Root472D3]